MITSSQTDECGGIEVADGSSSDGNQYWYIMKPTFPYTIKVNISSQVQSGWSKDQFVTKNVQFCLWIVHFRRPSSFIHHRLRIVHYGVR